MTATVGSEGQVTIPKHVLDHLGIRPGAEVEFRFEPDGRVLLVKAGPPQPGSRFARFRGIATVDMTTDEIMAMTRGEG